MHVCHFGVWRLLCFFGSSLNDTQWHVSTKQGNLTYLSYACIVHLSDIFHTAGAVASDDHKGDASPASTVPANDEAALAHAKASYQSAKMKTPEDKIRRAPATPRAPLSRDVQSVEILTTEGDKQTERDQKRSNGQKSKVKKQRGPLKGRKTTKKKVTKAKQVKQTTKDGAKMTKTKEQTLAKMAPSHATTPEGTTTSPGTSTTGPDASTTSPGSSTAPSGVSTTSPGASTAAPGTSAPHRTQPTQPIRKASLEIGSPDLAENRSPAPEAVAGMLNRTSTGDLAETHNMVRTNAEAALPAVGPHEARVRDGTRVRVRNKEYHNRRMRFYRSLDSFLSQKTEKPCSTTVS